MIPRRPRGGPFAAAGRLNANEKRKKKVVFEGVVYDSLSSCASKLRLSQSYIHQRIKKGCMLDGRPIGYFKEALNSKDIASKEQQGSVLS
jgi:hypothetical protein